MSLWGRRREHVLTVRLAFLCFNVFVLSFTNSHWFLCLISRFYLFCLAVLWLGGREGKSVGASWERMYQVHRRLHSVAAYNPAASHTR